MELFIFFVSLYFLMLKNASMVIHAIYLSKVETNINLFEGGLASQRGIAVNLIELFKLHYTINLILLSL